MIGFSTAEWLGMTQNRFEVLAQAFYEHGEGRLILPQPGVAFGATPATIGHMTAKACADYKRAYARHKEKSPRDICPNLSTSAHRWLREAAE